MVLCLWIRRYLNSLLWVFSWLVDMLLSLYQKGLMKRILCLLVKREGKIPIEEELGGIKLYFSLR